MDIRNMDPKIIEALKVISLACPSLLASNNNYFDVSSDCVSHRKATSTTHLPSMISTKLNHEQLANSTPFSVQALLAKKGKLEVNSCPRVLSGKLSRP